MERTSLSINTHDLSRISSKSISATDLEELKRENKKLRKALSIAVSNVDHEKDCSTDRTRNELSRLKRRIKQTEIQREEADQIAINLGDHVKFLQEEISKYKAFEDNVEIRLETMVNSLEHANAELEEKANAIANAHEHIQNIEEKCSSYEQMIELKDKEIAQLKLDLGILKEKEKQRNSDRVSLAASLEEEIRKSSYISKKYKEFEEKNNSMSKKITELEAALIKAEEDEKCVQNETEGELSNLRKENTELKSRIIRREEKLQRWKTKMLEIERERRQLADEVHSLASTNNQNKKFVATINDKGDLRILPSDADGCFEESSNVPLSGIQQSYNSMKNDLENEKKKSITLQQQVCRLRERLIFSEERQKANVRRQLSQMHGKELESKYIWKKYIDAVSSPR